MSAPPPSAAAGATAEAQAAAFANDPRFRQFSDRLTIY
jgi:HIV Tat-specific factor 1